MTNGEKIKELFPQGYFLNQYPFCGSSLEKFYLDDKKSNHSCLMAQEDWWNSEYKEPIKALEQEPRKGHWIGIDEEPHEDWECDNCGFAIWADENIEKFHYCPHCGAKMDGKEQKE